MKINPDQIHTIIHEYTINYVSMIELAKRYSVSRMAIWKILHKNNVNTTKQAANITTSCDWCNKIIVKPRYQVRKNLHSFCSHKHFSLWLNRDSKTNPLISYRHGSKIARKLVSEHFPLLPWHVVHHIDKNNFNNALENLLVFESQSDHVKFHRQQYIEPIWIGKKYLESQNQPSPAKELLQN